MGCGTIHTMDTTQYKIFTELDSIKSDYETKEIQILEGLPYSQFKIIKMCEFYSNSTYIGRDTSRFGERTPGKNKDGMGRDKPFYNIVNYRVTLAKTATDLDVKDINIVADSEKYWVKAMFLNKEVYNWMKETNFSLTLNKMGYTRAKYGGYLVKKTIFDDDNGEEQLKIDVVEWKNAITSQVDILNNPIVELHHFTPVDFMKKNDVWDNIPAVLEAWKKLKPKDRPNTVEVYEVLGEFPKSIYLEAEKMEVTPESKYEFSLQKYFIAVVANKKFKLYCDEMLDEKMTDTYGYLAWEEMSGRGLGRGVIEDSEEAQVWTNDAVINEKRAMDLAGRVGIKTTSKKLGNNILQHDHGKIYELEANADINSFNLAPSALGQFQSQIDKWKVQADYVTSSFDAATGEQPPSGTPLGTTQLLNAVATKPFDYRREEWGIHLTQMFEEWVLPFIIKKLYKGHVLRADYSDEELQLIDKDLHALNHNKMVKDMMLKGQLPTAQDAQMVQGQVQGELQKYGKTRFIDFPEGYFDDVECGVTIITTGEQKNKAATLQSLSSIMDNVVKSYNPQTGEFGVLKDPTLSKIFGNMIEIAQSGLSPIALGLGGAAKSMAPTPSATPSPAIPQQSTPLAPTQ